MTALRLGGDALDVVLTPDRGCDIVSIVDRRTGTDVLFRTPWAAAPGAGVAPAAGGSQAAWLAAYRGGWQVLCPNAGPERAAYGTVWGFHGEASLVPWRLLDHDGAAAVLETELFTAPVRIRRELAVDGPLLRVVEHVTNCSPQRLELLWMHHPAFGAPLVDEGSRLYCGARTVVADAEAPGTVLDRDGVYPWPVARTSRGEVDLTVLPGPERPREVFGALTDFGEPFFAIVNPRLDLGVGVRWDQRVFPHAWLWQEMHATAGFPWYRRAYVAAVEPSCALPGTGTLAGRRRGAALAFDPGERRSVELELVVFAAEGEVVRIGPGGQVGYAGAGGMPA